MNLPTTERSVASQLPKRLLKISLERISAYIGGVAIGAVRIVSITRVFFQSLLN